MQRVLPVVFLLCGLGVYGLTRPSAPASSGSPEPREARPRDNRELVSLRREIGELSEDVDTLFETQSQLQDAVPAEPTPEQDDPPGEAELEARTEATLTRLAAVVQAEPVDVSWAPQTESAMNERLLGLRAVRSLDRVECRSTLCRVELRYDETVDANALADELAQVAPWATNTFYSVETIGEHRAWLYLSREGHTLPGA